MASSEKYILLVDDDEAILEFLAIHIEGAGYQVKKAQNGQEAIALISENPKVVTAVISDVNMPEMNGYELCENIRDDIQTQEIPFVFISALTTLEEKLKGFGVGGDDYITKPLDGAEVVIKVKNIIDNRLRHTVLSQQVKEAQQVAMQAMSYTANLGQVLEFLQTALQCSGYEELAVRVFEVTETFGLQCNIQFFTPQGILNFTRKGMVSPLEANIVEMARNKGRIFDFGPRTTINYADFSLFIKNMPVDDADKYGQIKDLLGNLCNAIEAKTKLLLTERKMDQKDALVAAVNKTIEEVDQTFHAIQEENFTAIDAMMNDMEDAMLQLGLTEGQEDSIRMIAQTLKERTTENFKLAEGLYEEFQSIHMTLESILK